MGPMAGKAAAYDAWHVTTIEFMSLDLCLSLLSFL
jgi:hypothetical protein